MKRIIDYPNYTVDEHGNVWYQAGIAMNKKATSITNKGYERVTLSHGGEKKSFSVHRLVAMYYIPNPLNLPQVNHKDGNKLNNYHSNLEWNSASNNIVHSFQNGLSNYKGERHGQSKLTEVQVRKIKKRILFKDIAGWSSW